MFFMLDLTEGEQIATELTIYGNYLRKPRKIESAMKRLKKAVEKDGHKLIKMRPISYQEYKEFIDKYNDNDAEVVKF